MGPGAHAAAMAGLVAAAALLTLFPRTLFAEAGGGAHRRRHEAGLGVGLLAAGAAVFELAPADSPAARLLLALVIMALCAVTYADLRFLIIPDLYAAIIAAPALAGPLSPGLAQAALGAVVCGGLLFAIAWLWKRLSQVEGIGFGDVKLAAALGALLGAQYGLWAITASAAGGAAVGLTLQALRRDRQEPLLFPYGAALALAGGMFLIWRSLA
jgi:leader peptidase (prepilin peptidase)/N-methyltransferase